ncbi:PLP-dependent aminotransferase family protein [Cohaesibacter gelatinilyticus]|uniref:Transcriptional regulator, GntR family n=1 Tax=Cohaesibacter gelatinilyticus TaxID=372072 RepID=A0A285NMU7_9HYPH|nr:PLP-dependent aminotransferase family protein [Cohaesibacter gelatinilyticus]SNZ09186.1 transcriptional regulator, GntR family [Cohaesibacter gelatinilyticus]
MQISKIEQVVRSIETAIQTGALQPGSRLPSVRAAAEQYDVAKNTIVEAYARLAALQSIYSRQGSGFFVSDRQKHISVNEEAVTQASDIVSLLRAQLKQDFDIRPGDGRPPLSWMQDTLPKRVDTSLLISMETDQSGYGSPLGNTRLRELIARRFANQGTSISPSQIVTTFGANHALDLIIRRYLSEGQTVLVDAPGYYPLFAKLKLAKVNAIGIPRGPTGPDLNALESLAHRYKPRLFFTQSTAHNPTGTSFDLQTAHNALQLAVQHNFMIVDDDPFIDLHGHGVSGTRLWELDGFRKVIFVGSHSKLLSASFRSGHIVASPDLISDLTELKMITAVNSSRLSEMLIAQMIESSRYDRHLKKLGRRLEDARAACMKAIEQLDLTPFSKNPNGFYTLVELPEDANIQRIQSLATKRRIFVAQGQWFFPSGSTAHKNSLRINFSRSADKRFFNYLHELVT